MYQCFTFICVVFVRKRESKKMKFSNFMVILTKVQEKVEGGVLKKP